MHEETIEIEGLRTILVGASNSPTLVVLLHGYAMRAADLSPFAHSMQVPALYLFPEGPLSARGGSRPDGEGRAWFPLDHMARQVQPFAPRDFSDRYPEGLAEARALLSRYLQACLERFRPRQLVLGGFSQGGMLACDLVLHRAVKVSGLLLMSASRLSGNVWTPLAESLATLPALVSHGEADQELAWHAGTTLRDFLVRAGADVTWVPFAGGHEIPLLVWRAVRRFLRGLPWH